RMGAAELPGSLNPNWKPKTSKKKEAPTSNVTAQVEVSVTPSAPQTQAEVDLSLDYNLRDLVVNFKNS
ncbi:hypothetical protein PIB30_115690, partial [Stylosanthes scabra]|nr:hypothetical protein [Stylosanthes scabra]